MRRGRLGGGILAAAGLKIGIMGDLTQRLLDETALRPLADNMQRKLAGIQWLRQLKGGCGALLVPARHPDEV